VKLTMYRYSPVALALAACIGSSTVLLLGGYFHAYAQSAGDICNVDCLSREINRLNQKADALERSVAELTAQTSKSVKLGQTVTLHTQAGRGGGCLTYIGPSGDQGGFVSWNVNCSLGTSWTIN
jgi:hypothetical protein